MVSVVLAGREKHCMMWVGIADKTDLANVTLPDILRFLDFQLQSFASSLEIRSLKLECLGEIVWIGKPR